MAIGAKIKLSLNILIDVAAIVYCILLWKYNHILHGIQDKYTTVIERVWHIVEEPHYYYYLFSGLVFVVLLLCISVYDFTWRNELGALIDISVILINVFLLIVLIHLYSDPVFTTFVVFATGGAVLTAAQS